MKTFAFLFVLFLTLSINQLRSQTCSGTQTITSNSGTFSDRTSGETYGDNLDCRWLIQPANGRRVTLTFSRFNTEQNVDFVTIYDGATVNDRVLGRFSGSSLPMSVTATGGVVLLRFTSDAFVSFNGWAVNYVTESASAIDPTQIQWQKVSALGDRSVTSFGTIGNTLFVGTNGSGIFRSSDNGTTWSIANTGLGSNLNVSGMAANSTNIFAIARGNLLTSVDLGNSWVGASTATTISAVITHRDWVYIISGGDILRTANNGATWQNVSNILFARSATSIISDGTRLFTFSPQGIFISSDNGDSWQIIPNSNNLVISRPTVLSGDLFGISFEGSSGFFCGSSKLFINRGSSFGTWILSTGTPAPTALFTLGNNLFVGNCGAGIYFTPNKGTTWNTANQGLTGLSGSTTVNAFTWTGQMLYAGTTTGLFRSPLSITSSVSNENTAISHELWHHPNPCSEFTTIQYTLVQASHVQIDLYSLLGTRLATLVQEQQAAGNYVVPLDVRHYPSGQYYYRLRVNGEQVTRALQVIR